VSLREERRKGVSSQNWEGIANSRKVIEGGKGGSRRSKSESGRGSEPQSPR